MEKGLATCMSSFHALMYMTLYIPLTPCLLLWNVHRITLKAYFSMLMYTLVLSSSAFMETSAKAKINVSEVRLARKDVHVHAEVYKGGELGCCSKSISPTQNPV